MANIGPAPAGALQPDHYQLVFTDIAAGQTGGSGATSAQTVVIRNVGAVPLVVPAGGLAILDDPSVAGDHSSLFQAVNWPSAPLNVAPGAAVSLGLRFAADGLGVKAGILRVVSNDPGDGSLDIPLRGIGTESDAQGTVSGDKEPSLQRILNAFRIPIVVGDADGEDTVNFPTPRPPGTPTDEVEMQRLVKAGDGPVTIESLADYAFNTRNGPVGHYGIYSPGTKDAKTELFAVAASEYTSTNPSWGGSFDPGATPFGLYGDFNGSLFEINGLPRGVYSEDTFNTWDAVNQKKIRFFPLKNPDGSVAPNAFVFAFEEFNTAYDSNDIVGIIRNVKPVPAGPEVGTENLDRGMPSPTRLVFNRVQTQPPTRTENGQTVTLPNNVVHDRATVRVRNTGDAALAISSVVLSDTTNYRVNTGNLNGAVIAPGGALDIEVQFIATAQPAADATLTINTNDADEPATVIQLSGNWQNHSENNEEPHLPDILRTLGYGTNVVAGNETLNLDNDEGKVRRVGDEVLSPYWKRADAARAVEVIELAAFHTFPNDALLKWHYQGSTTTTTLFTMDGLTAQSFLPHAKGSSSVAAGVFKPTTQGSDTNPAFGFRIDSEWSDPTRNKQEKSGGGYGHHVRFWVARDGQGNVIPNAYLMAMDYDGINYDYDDNVYLIRNIVPAAAGAAPAAPTLTARTSSTSSIDLTWSASSGAARYTVERRASGSSQWTMIASTVTGTSLTDANLAPATAYSYRVTAISSSSAISAPSGAATAITALPAGTPVAVSISDAVVTEPTTGEAAATFSISLSAPSTGQVAVNFVTTDGTAVAGSDYVAATGEITFEPGETTKTLEVRVLADSEAEAAETFSVNLTVAGGEAILAKGAGVATINDVTPQPPQGTSFDAKTKVSFAGADGRPVKLTLKGPGTGQLIEVGGGVVRVTLTGTTAASALSLSGGRATLDHLTVDGSLKSLTGKTIDVSSDLAVSGSLAKLQLGNVSGGHTITVGPGAPLAAAFGAVSDTNLIAPAIKSLSALRWLNSDTSVETIQASNVASLTIKGDFGANVTADDIGKISVTGAVAGSNIRSGGNIASVKVGSIRDSRIFAGVRGDVAALADSVDQFSNQVSVIRAVSIGAKAAVTFSNTFIASPTIGKLSLGRATTDNGGTPFGVASGQIASIAGTLSDGAKLKLKNLLDASNSSVNGDLVIRVL